MANALYDPGREGFLDGTINWSTGDIRVITLLAGYVFSAAHKFVSELTPGTYEISRSAAGMTGKSVTNGVADAADHTHGAVSGGDIAKFAIYQHDGGGDTASRLIAFIDNATGLPLPTNGSDVQFVWSDGVDKIFKL